MKYIKTNRNLKADLQLDKWLIDNDKKLRASKKIR